MNIANWFKGKRGAVGGVFLLTLIGVLIALPLSQSGLRSSGPASPPVSAELSHGYSTPGLTTDDVPGQAEQRQVVLIVENMT